jgi:hypothetical protein
MERFARGLRGGRRVGIVGNSHDRLGFGRRRVKCGWWRILGRGFCGGGRCLYGGFGRLVGVSWLWAGGRRVWCWMEMEVQCVLRCIDLGDSMAGSRTFCYIVYQQHTSILPAILCPLVMPYDPRTVFPTMAPRSIAPLSEPRLWLWWRVMRLEGAERSSLLYP